MKIKRFSLYHPRTYTESWVWITGSWVFPYFSGPSSGWPLRWHHLGPVGEASAGTEPGVLSPNSFWTRPLCGSCAALWFERPGLEGWGGTPKQQLGGPSHEHNFWNECVLQSPRECSQWMSTVYFPAQNGKQLKTEFDRKYGFAWVLKDKSGFWVHKWLIFHLWVLSARLFTFSSSASSQWPFTRTGRRHNNQTDCGSYFSWRCWTVWCREKGGLGCGFHCCAAFVCMLTAFSFFSRVLLTAQMTYFEVSNKKKLNRLLFGSWFCLFLANLEEVLTLSATWLSVEKKKSISCVLLFFIFTGPLTRTFFAGKESHQPANVCTLWIEAFSSKCKK